MRKPTSFIATKDPLARVQNGYEALYYNVESGDPEVDELLQKALSDAYREHDIVLEDKRLIDVQHAAMLDAYVTVARELNGSDLSPNQRLVIEMAFDDFAQSNDLFYDKFTTSYERRFDGEPIDFAADCARTRQKNGSMDSSEPELTTDALDDIFETGIQSTVTSGLNYTQAVPAVKATQQTTAYKPIVDVPVPTEDTRKFKDALDELNDITVNDNDDLEDDGPEI